MSVLTDRRDVVANTTVANVLAGKTQEFITERSVVDLYATGETAGVFCSLIIGTEVVVEDQEISAANRFPIVPDDFVARGGAFKGDRLVVKIRNSTGLDAFAFVRVEINPA